MRTTTILILAALAVPAHALTLGLHVAATHLGELNHGAKRTMATPGAYAVLDNGVTLGAYRNSLGRTSVQAGYTWAASSHWALSAGLVTGYPGTSTGYAHERSSRYPLPYLAVSYRFGGSDLGARALWSPQKTHPVALSVEWTR